KKSQLSSHFTALGQKIFPALFFSARTEACCKSAFLLLHFSFRTFHPKKPLVILYTLHLAFFDPPSVRDRSGHRLSTTSRPADMCGWTGHIQGNGALRVCEAARPSARFSAPFCRKGGYQGGRISDLRSRQKWVPPGAWRFCDTLRLPGRSPPAAMPLFIPDNP